MTTANKLLKDVVIFMGDMFGNVQSKEKAVSVVLRKSLGHMLKNMCKNCVLGIPL